MWYHKLNPRIQCHIGSGRDIPRWDKRKYMDLFVGIFWEGPEEVIFKGSLTRIRPMMNSRDKLARANIWRPRAVHLSQSKYPCLPQPNFPDSSHFLFSFVLSYTCAILDQASPVAFINTSVFCYCRPSS